MSFRVQLINMGTRAAAFQAKLRCLHDYHQRLLHNSVPLPSGSDIANTLKYFSQTLLTVLKDVRNSPLEMIKDPDMDQTRMSSYPNLEYSNLYNSIAMLIDVTPNIQYGIQLFGKAILNLLGCILLFLDRDLIDNLPYLCASLFSVLPPTLYQEIINYLCYYILPFTITRKGDQESLICQASASVSSVIMFVFHFSNNPAHHCQLLECLMTNKHNVVKDILCVIAYGTSTSRSVASKLLFYYWPAFNADLFDRKVLLVKYNSDLIPFICQRDSCTSTGNAEATKVCYDHNISILHSSENPPPLYCCTECANAIHREHSKIAFKDIIHPMAQVSMICENKNCRSTDKSAFSICFSTECISYNGNHPIRYCNQCHSNRHNAKRGVDHIYHRSLLPVWQMDLETSGYLIEAVVSLLREAKPLNLDLSKDSTILSVGERTHDNISNEDRQQLGKYGIWLLVGRCSPTHDSPFEILGRLLNMLFHWFHITAYSSETGIESTLEKLKIDHICGWLKDIAAEHDKTFISCLLPHPPEYARVGGHWDTLASRTQHLKEGLQRLICLVPYEIITQEIWETVMPHWMEAITNDVPEKELHELKIVLRKILDPLGFDVSKMYNFITIRFEKTTAKVQMQALHWLQVLTRLEILIPLQQLFNMFGDGVRIMKHGVQHEIKERQGKQNAKDLLLQSAPRRSSISPVVEDESISDSAISDDEAPTNRTQEFSTDSENNLTCCILMLDILLKQMELQDVEQHQGINTQVCENICKLLKCMVTATAFVTGPGSHMCSEKTDCLICEASVMWHQLAAKIIQFLAPAKPIREPDPPPVIETFDDDKDKDTDKDHKRDRDVSFSMAALPIPLGPLGGLSSLTGSVPVAVPVPEQQPFSIGNVLMQMPHVCSMNDHEKDIAKFFQATDEIMTATVETVSEPLGDMDLAAMPSEKVVTAVARSVTLSDADVAQATVQIAKPSIVGIEQDSGDNINQSSDESSDGDFWHTSVGKFKFSIDTLPQTLQFIHQLLNELPSIDKPEILYQLTRCLNTLVLHGDAFAKAARDHRGFFIWCQENLLIKNLWELCNAEHSHISQVGVPLLLHCITLPVGSDVFWKILQEFFHHSDWRVRFQAVERVTVIARFMDSTPLRTEVNLQTALATAFCHLIASMDDINVYVAQRATLYLGTIHDSAIRSLLFCLESQFDTFIVDRPVVLQSIYQLLNSLSDRKILKWDFFLSRFDTLFIEAQVNLEKNGDLSYLRDLRNSENGSEILTNKIAKAREALSQSSDSLESRKMMSKTLSASFGKCQYKRTMSAPANFTPRQESKIEKIYNRQISAPLLKRKTSRFGLGQFLHGNNHAHNLAASPHHNPHSQPHSPVAPVPPSTTSISTTVNHLHPYTKYNHHLSPYPPSSPIMSPHSPTPSLHFHFHPSSNQSSSTTHLHHHHHGGATDGHMGYDDVNFSGSLFRVIDLEESTDKETIHLLIHLLMQFMSRQDLAFPTEEKPIGKQITIVLKHIYLLMGFNQHEKMFQFSSPRIRCSSVFNSFLANLPQFLDQNHSMGATESLFTFIMYLLVYVPYPNSSIPGTFEVIQNASYSLWFLETQVRKNWLMSVLVILYKYNLTVIPESLLSSLIRIIVNSLEAQFHQCRRIPTTILTQETVRRPEIKEPLNIDPEEREHSIYSQVKPIPQSRKQHDSSIDCDETESELVVIPESDLSDSTLQGSIEGIPEEIEQTKKKVERTKALDVKIEASKSVSEGMRMMFSSAILSPPVNVQKAIVVTQTPSSKTTQSMVKDSSSKTQQIIASATTCHLRTVSAVMGEKQTQRAIVQPVNGNGNRRANSPIRALGRQQRIIDTNGQQPSTSSSSDDMKKPSTTQTRRRNLFGSPESPLSRMDILSPPDTDISTDGNDTPVLTPTSVRLDFPMLERLLPIGNSGRENVASICERVREALAIPDISHIKSQDNLDKMSESPQNSSRGASPRKLMKQVALIESPPHVYQDGVDEKHQVVIKKMHVRHDFEHEKRTMRKIGAYAVPCSDSRLRFAGSWAPPSHTEDDNEDDEDVSARTGADKQSSFRIGDECFSERCSECGALKEEYTDEEIGLFFVLLGTFIHREPALACPFLPDILVIVSKVANHHTFSWQYESSTHLPGGSQAVAHQFIRCVLHQLAPNGVFYQIFLTQNPENVRQKFFKCTALALLDFAELNPASPVQLLMESLNNKKTLPLELSIIMRNLSEYLQSIPIDTISAPTIWTAAIQGIESLFRRIVFNLPNMEEIESLLSIMMSVFKMPALPKAILEPFSKIFSFAVQNVPLKHKIVHELCFLNSRAFTKERDKLQLARQVAFELIQCLKFKTVVPDNNLLLIIGIILQDLGGSLPKGVVGGLPENPPFSANNTGDCMRQYLNDVLEFLADFHTLSKIKNFKNGSTISSGMGLSEDTLGGALKGAISQYLALEMSRGNSKENRAVSRYLPWLYNAPTTLQQGPKEFTECVSHVRLLSWLLMGSLTHTAMTNLRKDTVGHHQHHSHFHMPQQQVNAQAVPQDASCHIADHIQTIFAGFLEQSKTSVLHMSSLFHAFTLCQLWTVYLEQLSYFTNDTIALSILFEFWVKVTPCLLQLISNSKLSEMVNLHFLSLLESLKETRSTILSKLFPLWSPLLTCKNLSGTLQVRLQSCRDPPSDVDVKSSDALLKYLQRLQFKMAQIELQSSQATTQFYSL